MNVTFGEHSAERDPEQLRSSLLRIQIQNCQSFVGNRARDDSISSDYFDSHNRSITGGIGQMLPPFRPNTQGDTLPPVRRSTRRYRVNRGREENTSVRLGELNSSFYIHNDGLSETHSFDSDLFEIRANLNKLNVLSHDEEKKLFTQDKDYECIIWFEVEEDSQYTKCWKRIICNSCSITISTCPYKWTNNNNFLKNSKVLDEVIGNLNTSCEICSDNIVIKDKEKHLKECRKKMSKDCIHIPKIHWCSLHKVHTFLYKTCSAENCRNIGKIVKIGWRCKPWEYNVWEKCSVDYFINDLQTKSLDDLIDGTFPSEFEEFRDWSQNRINVVKASPNCQKIK